MTGFNIQRRLFPVEFASTSVHPKEAKRNESPFGSVANQSTIHFRLKRLTIPAASYKKSCYLKVFLKTGSFQCCAVDIK